MSPTEERALEIIRDLTANGATFAFVPAGGSLPATFTYSLGRGGDRWRCRGLIKEAKSDQATWHELVTEIGRRCQGGAE